MSNPKLKLPVEIAVTSIFISLVYVATISLQITLPVSNGFFNLGEMMIYLAALLFGPRVAAIAGGVGASLADLTLSYAAYAPGTLAIKALEGYVVGAIFWRLKKLGSGEAGQVPVKSMVNLTLAGMIFAAYIVIFGSVFFPGETWLWLVLGGVVIASVLTTLLYIRIKLTQAIFSIIVGACVMATGYLFYTMFAYTWLNNALSGGTEPLVNYQAVVNLPFDVLQCLVGAVIAIPTYQALVKAGVEKIIGQETKT